MQSQGFKKRGNNFAKDCDGFSLTVNIQSSRYLVTGTSQ
ncbi:DUF4304 domain-containing protein [Bacillus sp. ISL-45]|nr:DUF4304 domain-containing protein [Bacillus sp. ISL-45]